VILCFRMIIMNELCKDNHYVPQFYLKRWSTDGLHINGYHTLVSHPKIPLWKQYSIRSIAYYKYLYTKMSKNGEVDEFERWLGKEFESPAENSIDKAITGHQMSYSDWQDIIRFIAAQYVRTPARLLENMERWQKQFPELMQNILNDLVVNLKKHAIPDQTNLTTFENDTFPGNVKIVPNAEKGTSRIEVNALTGRGMWLWEMKVLLTNTVNELLKHKWCILFAPPEFEWITNDDPVVCLNYYSDGKYDFKGGWGSKGSEIICPISPRHLCYTHIGNKPPSNRYLSIDLSIKFQKLFAERAYRWIFAKRPLNDIAAYRPRIVDKIKFDHEKEEWLKWHTEQSMVEPYFEP
jgi:hypothetical protein